MKRRNLLAISTAVLALGPVHALRAQDTQKPYTPEQLDQMLAPIALYPDALLAQTLMAAGYPLEVVEAARWSQANPNLKGDAAVAAVKDKDWDVSVKSLTAFPQVLKMMNDQLDWTQKIGNAMIAQQKDVADSVQRLRAKAAAAGNLKSTPQQTVTTQPAGSGSTIVIEPANPQSIYVPYYNPAWAYGPWPYPAYPPPYYPPPPYYGAALMSGDGTGALEQARATLDHAAKTKDLSPFDQFVIGTAYFAEGRFDSPDAVLALPEPAADRPLAKALWRYARGEVLARKGDVAGVRR